MARKMTQILIFMIFKGIAELLGRWAKCRIDTNSSDDD